MSDYYLNFVILSSDFSAITGTAYTFCNTLITKNINVTHAVVGVFYSKTKPHNTDASEKIEVH